VSTVDAAQGLSLWTAVRRRTRALVWVATLVFLGALAAAAFWPPRYTATGTILIEQQELPSDLVRSTVSSYATQRIQVISQQVMTTDNLMAIIEKYGLYASLRKRSPREEVVARMRRDSSLQMISADVIDPRDGRPTKATIAFTVGYSSSSPQLAAKVANELVSLYMNRNIESRQQSTRDAATFLQGESARLSGEIDAIQARLADFKSKHADELPDLTQLNLQGTIRVDEEVRDTDTQLRSLEQQRVYLEAQLAQLNPTSQIYASTGERVQSPEDRLKYLRTEYARISALYAPDHPDVVRMKREIEGLEASTRTEPAGEINDYRRQLEAVRTELAEAKKRYAPNHPDIVKLQRLVDALEFRLGQEQPGGFAADAKGGGKAAADAAPDNPAYIQIQAQREATLSQMQALRAKRAGLEDKRQAYEKSLAAAPAVERDYAAILRELEAAQLQYREVQQKVMQAQIAENLETERKGERFTLIDPPFTPEEPTSPNRPLIAIFGLMLALGAALATVALLENLDGSVRGREDLQRLAAAPPLALIPVMLKPAEVAARRRRRVLALAGTASSVVAALIGIHFLYRPLDVLWAVALRRLGIGV